VTDGNGLRKPLPMESCAANRRKIDTDGIAIDVVEHPHAARPLQDV
jgi:hypothetical protein